LRLLTHEGSLLALAVSLLLIAVSPVQSADPTTSPERATMPSNNTSVPTPDHGVDEATFYQLWSGDSDTAAPSQFDNASSERALAAGTDVPFDRPPAAAAQWTRGELGEFPATGPERSIHPADAALTDGRFLRDAYISIFAVLPSTRARLSPTRQPLYIAPEGDVLGTADYRVVLPNNTSQPLPPNGSVSPNGSLSPIDSNGSAIPNNTSRPARRTTWELADAAIERVQLRVDGVTVAETDGVHAVSLAYDDLGPAGLRSKELTLVADITVRVRKTVGRWTLPCADPSNDSCRANWNRSTTTLVETVTVRDSLDVVQYDLNYRGTRARYPNGDLGLLLYRGEPWLGYSLPSGGVNGVWRFYTASNQAWDRLTVTNHTATTTIASPARPLQVHAYPFGPGPTPSSRRAVSILDILGVRTDAPALPETVHLDVQEDGYTASYGLVTRSQPPSDRAGSNPRVSVTMYGLVRGVRADVPISEFEEVPINETTLSLRVVNTTREEVHVAVELRDAATGTPINTADRDGYIVMQGEQVNTTANGTARVTLPRNLGGISARFEPGPWWRAETGYVGSADTVYAGGTVLAVVGTIYRAVIPVGLVLTLAFLVDRISGQRIWPPWRGL